MWNKVRKRGITVRWRDLLTRRRLPNSRHTAPPLVSITLRVYDTVYRALE